MDETTTNGDDQLQSICRDINSRDSQVYNNALRWIFDHKDQLLDTGRKPKLPNFQRAQVLHRIRDLVSILNDVSLKCKALDILTRREYGSIQYRYLKEMSGFFIEVLLYADEADLGLVTGDINRLIDYKRVEGAWLIDCGFVDVLCIRIASMKTAEVARRFVECLFSFIKTFSEIQATETVKVSYLASLILKDEDGVFSAGEIQLTCINCLKNLVMEETCLVAIMKTDLPATLLSFFKREKRTKERALVGDILINITSSDKGETKTLVDLGLLDILLPILQSKDYEGEMFDTVFWMVANITGDCKELRNRAVQIGIAELVVEAASAPDLSYEKQVNFAWALGNFFRPNAEGVPMETAKKVLECLKNYITDTDHMQIQRDGMYGIFFLTTLYEGSSHEGVALLLELGLLPTVMNFVKKQDIYYTKPALQVIVNIFQSDNKAAIKELLDDGLCQEMNHTLGLHRLEGHAMDVLYYLAKQGHTEEVFKAIPQATMSGIIEHGGQEHAEKMANIFLMMAQEANPITLEDLDYDALTEVSDYVFRARNSDSLSALMDKVMAAVKEGGKKHGLSFAMDTDTDEDVTTETENT